MRLSRAARVLLSPPSLILLALLVRVGLAILMGERYYFADTAEYEAAAIRLMNGLGPGETTPRAPLYPVFMAFGFFVGGVGNHLVVRLIQVLLGTLVVALTGRLARALGGPLAERPALIAAAFSPLLVFSSSMLYPTTLYTLVLLGTTMAVFAIARRPTRARGALLGALLPMGWMTDPVIVAPFAALLAGLLLRMRSSGRALTVPLAVALLTATAVALPYALLSRPAPGTRGVFMQKAQYVLDWSRSAPSMADTRRVRVPHVEDFHPLTTRAFVAREWELMRTQPLEYAHDVSREFLHFFSPMPDRVQTQNRFNQPRFLWLGALHFAPLLLLGMLGLFLGVGPAPSRWTLASVVLATASFYAFFFSQARYRIPVEPHIIVLASLALVRLLPRLVAFLAGPQPPGSGPANLPRRS